MATINTKPAAGLFGGALTTVGLGLLARYTSYAPSIEEAAGITTLVGFGVAWLVPDTLWHRYRGEDLADELPAQATDVPAALVTPPDA